MLSSSDLPTTAIYFFFFFNDTATTEIYTLSLHDALPIWTLTQKLAPKARRPNFVGITIIRLANWVLARAMQLALELSRRSEEHTSELQSLAYLVCRLLLEKKKKTS